MPPKFFAGYLAAELFDKPDKVAFPMIVLYPASTPEKAEKVETLDLSVSVGAPVRDGRFPLVMISHGSGGSPLFYRTLGLHLARGGFIVGISLHNSPVRLAFKKIPVISYGVEF